MKTISQLLCNVIENTTSDKIHEYCQLIKKAPGDQAWAIYLAKEAQWWIEDDLTTCASILNANGNQALAICYAKIAGWWIYSNEQTTQQILSAFGDKALAISDAITARIWTLTIDESINLILNSVGSQALAIFRGKNNGWLDKSDEEIYQMIKQMPHNRYVMSCLNNKHFIGDNNAR